MVAVRLLDPASYQVHDLVYSGETIWAILDHILQLLPFSSKVAIVRRRGCRVPSLLLSAPKRQWLSHSQYSLTS